MAEAASRVHGLSPNPTPDFLNLLKAFASAQVQERDAAQSFIEELEWMIQDGLLLADTFVARRVARRIRDASLAQNERSHVVLRVNVTSKETSL